MTPIDMSDIACMKATLSQMMELMESIMATYQSTQLTTQSTTQPATRSPECPFVRAIQQKKKHRNQKTRQQYKRRSLPITQLATQPITQPATLQVTQLVTQPATQPEYSVEQEEELQQTNAEKTAEKIAEKTAESTAEKASDNKATITKNTGLISTLPRQIATQQAENTTAIWPAISAYLGNITLWYITAMTTQEEDLLRRSQPIGPLQEDIGRYIFGRIETV